MVMFTPADQQLHGVDTGVTRKRLVFGLSRFNGSGWISFRSQHSQQFEPKFGDTVHGISRRGDAVDPDRWVPEEVVVQSSEQPEGRAWADEVKALKQGDIYVGRGSKQRGLLPSFWAHRYKVSKFGRDRAVEFHRAEVQGDPQYGLKAHELSGKRLLCHCRQNDKCHSDNLRDLFCNWQPHAFDPSSSERPPLSSELNILAKGREDREDSEESGLEDAEADAPQGWPGIGKPMVIGSGYVERRLCDGQGLCSPGAWAPEERQYPSSQARLFQGTAESISTVQLLSELALSRLVKPPFSQDVVERLRSEVKVILAREGIQSERVEG